MGLVLARIIHPPLYNSTTSELELLHCLSINPYSHGLHTLLNNLLTGFSLILLCYVYKGIWRWGLFREEDVDHS